MDVRQNIHPEHVKTPDAAGMREHFLSGEGQACGAEHAP